VCLQKTALPYWRLRQNEGIKITFRGIQMA